MLLLAFGGFALILAVFFESGLLSRRSTRDMQREELHRVVDAAQIWFVRPAKQGGGGDSYDSLDFKRIGLAAEAGALEWKGEFGEYRILDRSRQSFALEMTDLQGRRLTIDTLQFDSYPDIDGPLQQ